MDGGGTLYTNPSSAAAATDELDDLDGAYEPVGLGGGLGAEAGDGQGVDTYDQATDGGIDAEAPTACTYRSPTGRSCNHRTTGNGAVFCGIHGCPVASCPNSKSSKQQMCATCTSSAQEVSYEEPVALNPTYASGQALVSSDPNDADLESDEGEDI